MLNNEIKFWSDMLVASHPGWSVDIAHNWEQGPPTTSKMGVNIYAFDTSTCWSGACVVTAHDLQDAQDALVNSDTKRQAIQTAAQVELMAVSDTRASTQEDATRRAMVLVMYYMAQTQTMKTVKSHMGNLDGHWLALLYRFKSGKSLLRPVYRSPVIDSRLMSPVRLAQWVSEAMQQDAEMSHSGLNQHLNRNEELLLPTNTGHII